VHAGPVRIVGAVLVRDEDLYVERAIRNVAAFCDRIHVLDHMSADGTWTVLGELERELDHVELRRSRRASDSHAMLEQYVGTRTWALGVDGDELFEPQALGGFRKQLLAGEHADVFRLKGHVLNCDAIDPETGEASGYMAPPSRPITKLFYLGAVDRWTGAAQRLHEGETDFRRGYGWDSMRYLSETLAWDDDPLRCLHLCFVPRSSRDGGAETDRANLNETGEYDRTLVGALKRRVGMPPIPTAVAELHRSGSSWKRDWYARGPRVTVDASRFLGPG
jgi:hypothetical protein